MKRRKFIFQTSLGLGVLLPAVESLGSQQLNAGPYMATGIKIGEVTADEAIVWIRLTRSSKPVPRDAKIPAFVYLDEISGEWQPVNYFKEKYKLDRPDRKVKVIMPEGYTVQDLEGAAPGMTGEARITYRKKGSTRWMSSNWQAVKAENDFTTQIHLNNLQAAMQYELKAETRGVNGQSGAVTTGSFVTAALPADISPVHFMVTTCHEYNDQDAPGDGGFKIYKHMQALNPQFMVHTGDVVYYDQKAKTVPLAHWHWQRMFGLVNCVDFYRQVPTYFMKDDHDTWMNDCCPQSKTRFMGDLTFNQGVEIFRQQTPYKDKPYRTFRWGKHLQIWLVEGREYRSDNEMPDGPGKTIWGAAQMEWFTQTFTASDATYRVLITPTPIVGPDRPQKKDNHANSGFAHEGTTIKKFLATQKNAFIVCGDRHWQYASKDLTNGLMEFACGPASNEHASGWKKEDILPEHKYLNIVGGFLGVEIMPKADGADITFTHYSVDGQALHKESFSNKQA